MSEFLGNVTGYSHPKALPEESLVEVLTINIKEDHTLLFYYFLLLEIS